MSIQVEAVRRLRRTVKWHGGLATSVLLGLGCIAGQAAIGQAAIGQAATAASDTQARTYNIAAQTLGTALQEFAAQAGLQLLFSESDVAGMRTGGLSGSFTKDQALERLLAGSGLAFEFPKSDAVIIRRPGSSADSSSVPAAGAASTTQNSATQNPTPRTAAASRVSTGSASSGADSQSTADFQEVIVTGRAGVDERTKEETSYSVTTIDQKKLRLQGPTSVTESLKSVPGFWVEASGGEASGNVRARGVPVDGFGSITLLEDGMPVQHDPALGYLNGDQAFRLDETIDRIEVVRGGPSTVFYSNAPAGAVNYIPRRVSDHAEGLLKYTVGDYGLNRVDVWYGAPVGDWKLSLGGFYRYDDGIRDPGFHGDNGGQFRVSLERDFEGGQVSFDLKRLDDTVALDLGIPMRTYSDGKIRAVPGFDGHYGTIAGPETELARMKTASGSDFLFDNTLGTQVKRTQATLNLEFEIADHYTLSDRLRYDDTGTVRNGVFPNQLQSATSFLAAQLSGLQKTYPGTAALQLRYTDSPGTVYDVLNQNGNGLITVGGLRSVTAPIRELMNDARLMHKFEVGDQSHDATLGFYVADVSMDFSRYSSTALLDTQDNARLLDLVALDAAGNVLGTATDHGIYHYGYEWANNKGQSTTTAIYLSDEWQLTHSLRIDAGARWEQEHLTADGEVRQTLTSATPALSQMLAGTGQFVHFDERFSKVGWTVGANWQFTDRSGLFARYSPAFRLPNLGTYTTASPSTTNSTVNRPIIQTMDLGELGYKYANQWTNLYATAFWTKYDNVGYTNNVFNLNTSEPPFQQTRYTDTRTYGLELEGGFYPVEWFDLTFNATLEQPKYSGLRFTDNVGGKPVYRDYDGNQLIRVPKASVRVVPGVNLFDQRLRLQVAWEYEGARYVDMANSVVLPHYTVLNASASLAITDHFDVYGYVDNVTNSLGLTEGNPRAGELQNADAGANTFIARPILGRAFRLSLMYRF
jgi:outer membrane receptor protein involved in Fe transport